MGALSIWHILIIAVVALLLFGGRGKISDIMGDVGKGIKSFRQGLSDHDQPPKLPRDEPPKDSQTGR
jgi:sec-independent protein translocase protein TatA